MYKMDMFMYIMALMNEMLKNEITEINREYDNQNNDYRTDNAASVCDLESLIRPTRVGV